MNVKSHFTSVEDHRILAFEGTLDFCLLWFPSNSLLLYPKELVIQHRFRMNPLSSWGNAWWLIKSFFMKSSRNRAVTNWWFFSFFCFVITTQKPHGNFHTLVINYTHRDSVQSFFLRKDDCLILSTFQRISHWIEMLYLKKKSPMKY